MKKSLIFLLLLLPVILPAQTVNVDSLENVLHTKKLSPDDELSIYRELFLEYTRSDIDKAKEYAEKGLQLAKKEKNKLMMSKFIEYIARINYTRGDYDSSLDQLDEALKLALEIKDEQQELSIYSDIAAIYGKKNELVTALEYFTKVLTISEKLGDKDLQAKTLYNMAGLHNMLRNNERAMMYLEQSRSIVEEYNLPGILPNIYYQLGALYTDNKEIEKGMKYKLMVDSICNKGEGRLELCAFNCQSLAMTYYTEYDDFDKALEYASKSLEYAQTLGNPGVMSGSLVVMSNINIAKENWTEAEIAATKAWQLDSISMNFAPNSAFNLTVSNIYLKNTDKAITFLEKYKDLKNQYNDKSLHEALMNLEVKYETEKKEMRISTLEKEKTLYAWLGVAITVALLSIIGLLFYRHRSAIQKRKIAEQQIKQLEYEKEVIAIQSALKAEKAERDLIAHDLHDSVSSLLTVVKNNMNLYLDSEYKETGYFSNAFDVLGKSITELRRVVYHLKSFILTKEGVGAALGDFCCFIPNTEFHFKDFNRRFDPDKEYVLYDCACELINNALKHSGASRIDVHLNMDEETVYLSVADNGKGFDPQTIKPGIGLENIRSNLSAFGGHLDILSEPGKGTEANIDMEIKE